MPPASDKTTEQITRIEGELQEALMRGDVDWFAHNWLPDALYVHLSGGVDTLAEFIERLRSKATVYHSRQFGDVQVREFGDTAIVTGWSRIDIAVSGERKQLDTRFTRVYVRDGEQWLLATNQSGANRFLAEILD